MPTALKEAAVIPILKKPNLPTTPKNYRPVSTIPLISKIIEDAVLEQLNEYFHNMHKGRATIQVVSFTRPLPHFLG